MIKPDKKEFLEQAQNGAIVAVVMELTADMVTPVDVYYATGASYILESSEKGSAVGRYSFLGIEPVMTFSIRGKECSVKKFGTVERFVSEEPLRIVADTLKAHTFIGEPDLSPFPGGAVGYISYNYYETLAQKSLKPGLGLPQAVFMVTRYNIVFDNLQHTVKIICHVHCGNKPEEEYTQAVAGLQRLADSIANRRIINGLPVQEKTIPEMTSSFTREEFMDAVSQVKKYIVKGDAIQVVLSQRMETPCTVDPFLIFRRLRSINPSPYMFYLNFTDFVILGASPEIMVKVEDNKAVLRPIAGTRPRGATNQQDLVLKAELLADPKEVAEHTMLIDLARNDLGRIATAGTVSVDRYMEVELYSHVMHIVSEVSAQLAEGMDYIDVIKATFPAGTVSGAPKIRAMEIIDSFETVDRGPYAGLIGYMSYTGTFDSCITIRSMVVQQKKAYVQVGAGLVFDSEPSREYEETMNKARALLIALAGGKA
ncbi:MAG: anthranilate synthase component I family protein [Chitinivibrionales bacterium]|nr:anthranilate synthase component I family protein [Chitinivibrionales bacterium]